MGEVRECCRLAITMNEEARQRRADVPVPPVVVAERLFWPLAI